ncbi:unnamed protein product [Linum trigynum]|uniref:Retrovirus-related Pol polyprotein from transposon TNT 1-94-like beta-barrel domain-containing protein n=1 Tax=Linum trigynum TaxID=586398 RepID=A0AAV2D0E3_9ROSI
MGADVSPITDFTKSQVKTLCKFLGGEPKASLDNDWAGKTSATCDFLDSGCNDHIAIHIGTLTNSTLEFDFRVSIPNGDALGVTRIGSVMLQNGMVLPRVLLVPDFKCNLLFISRLTKDFPLALVFLHDFFVILDLRSRRMIGMGNQQDRLHHLRLFDELYEVVGRSAEGLRETSSALWHSRLGHPSLDNTTTLHIWKKSKSTTV